VWKVDGRRPPSVFRREALAKYFSDGLADPCLNGFSVEASVGVCAEAIDATVADVGHESLGLHPTVGAKVQENRTTRVAEADIARERPCRPGIVQDGGQPGRPEPPEAVPVAFLGLRAGQWITDDRHWRLRAFARLEDAWCREPARCDVADRLFKEHQTSVLNAWIARVEDVLCCRVAAGGTRTGRDRRMSDDPPLDHSRSRVRALSGDPDPGCLIEGIRGQAHEQGEERRLRELAGTRTVARREEHFLVDQHAAAVGTAGDHIAVVVDEGHDECPHIRVAIFVIDCQRVYIERIFGASRRHRQQRSNDKNEPDHSLGV